MKKYIVMGKELFTYVEYELIEKLGPSFRIFSRSPVGGGCIHHSLKLNTSHGDFFLKWNEGCADDMFVCESESLTELRRAVGDELVVPEVILSRYAGEYPGFIVMEFLERGQCAHQDEKLGYGLAALHREMGVRFGFYRDNYCGATLQKNDWHDGWSPFFINNRLRFLLTMIEDRRTWGVGERKVFDRLIVRLPQLLPADSEPSLIHGDLWSGNFMYTDHGPAIIDPASYYADREMELSIMNMFGGFSYNTWNAYQDAFPLEPGWEDRVRIYQLYHILNHYYLFGGSYGLQAVSVARRYL